MVDSRRIANRLIQDIEGRKGLGDEWDRLEQSIKQEIKAKWIEIIDNIVASS